MIHWKRRTAMEVFEDMMKLSYLSENFGGPHCMSDEQIQSLTPGRLKITGEKWIRDNDQFTAPEMHKPLAEYHCVNEITDEHEKIILILSSKIKTKWLWIYWIGTSRKGVEKLWHHQNILRWFRCGKWPRHNRHFWRRYIPYRRNS